MRCLIKGLDTYRYDTPTKEGRYGDDKYYFLKVSYTRVVDKYLTNKYPKHKHHLHIVFLK